MGCPPNVTETKAPTTVGSTNTPTTAPTKPPTNATTNEVNGSCTCCSPDGDASTSDDGTTTIVLIVIGTVVLLCLVACMFYFACSGKCCQSKEPEDSDPEPDCHSVEMANHAPAYTPAYAPAAEISSHGAPIVKSNDSYEDKPVHAGEPILMMPPLQFMA